MTFSALIYDREYPYIGYANVPMDNDVAHLQQRLASGKAQLQFQGPSGYLQSLLKALRIDPSSQTLVFSKTSLQFQMISPATPRAIYFNDDTYVAYIPNTGLLEISTMDSLMGAVFYTLVNRADQTTHLERETLRCLSCHDTFSLGGGGVPSFLFLSAYNIEKGTVLTNAVANPVTDETPLEERWGGWYVTGKLGGIIHLGNVLPQPPGQTLRVSQLHPRDIDTVAGFLDTRPYLSDKSDAVALLVFEHQVDLHNLIIHANYKSRMLLERETPGSSTRQLTFTQLSPSMQAKFKSLLEPLVRGLLFVHAAPLTAPVASTSGFDQWFQALGPRDPQGRSLRDLDLRTRLFRHPLSFLIYSQGFDFLPGCAKEYVYQRLAEILSGRDTSATYAQLSAAERRSIYEILSATKPEFAAFVAGAGASRPPTS